MLQIKNIRKEYRTGGLVQKALDGVSLNFRAASSRRFWDPPVPAKPRC